MRVTWQRKVFLIFNSVFLSLLSILCVVPIIHVFMISLSGASAIESGKVKFWPVDFTLKAYEYVIAKQEFYHAFFISVLRVGIALPVIMFLTVMAAYPLSRNESELKHRNIYLWYFIITMLFSGGLIPTYIIMQKTGLLNTIWALILPISVPMYNVMLLCRFFKSLPKEIEESAFMDGAGHWRTLLSIYIPLSMPCIATLVLFIAVGHWNAWFDGLIYMSRPENYPLQSYLQTVIIRPNPELISNIQLHSLNEISQRNNVAAQIFIATLPILSLYPFLQKHFTKGIMLGSVKG